MGMSLSKFWEFVMDREAWHAAIHGMLRLPESRTWVSDWPELNWNIMTAGWIICPWAHRSPEAEPGFEQSLTVTLSILEEFNSVVKLHPAPMGGQRRWWSQPSEECLCSVRSNSWTPWTAAHQAPLTLGICRQESWSGLPCPCLGIFPIQGSNPHLLHRQADSLPLSHLWSPSEGWRKVFQEMMTEVNLNQWRSCPDENVSG